MSLKLYRKKGSPNWYARGSVKGQFYERSTRTANRRQAEALRSKWEAALFSQKQELNETSEITFSDAMVIYLKDGGDDQYLDKLLQYFGTTALSEINNKAIRDATTELYPHHENSTINRQLYTPLSAIINHCAALDMCSPVRFKKLKTKKSHVKPAPQGWHDKILPLCDQPTKCALLLMVITGSRITSTLRLQWPDVDLNNGTAVLWSGTKNNTPNVLELPAILISEMSKLDSETEYVFVRKERSAFYRYLKKICKDNKIEYVPPHRAGRHTFATELLKEGFSLAHVQKKGHWKSSSLVSDVYGHLERSDLKASTDVLGQKFGKSLGKQDIVDINQNVKK